MKERSTWQGGPVFACLFIHVLEIRFIFVKNNPKLKGLKIFRHKFLYAAYADGTTFFLQDRKSMKELMNEFNTFSNFSGFKTQ